MKNFSMLSLGLMIACVSTGAAFGQDLNKVMIASEGTQMGGKSVRPGETIANEGALKTDKNSGAKIELLPSHTILEIAPSSEIRLRATKPNEPTEIEILSGMVRAKVQKTANAKLPTFRIRSPGATMGVRGTEFIAIANPVLAESEIVVFEGKVEFASTADPKDLKLVTQDHWGGIGGRFGSKTHELIHLPESAMKYFKSVSLVTEVAKTTTPGN